MEDHEIDAGRSYGVEGPVVVCAIHMGWPLVTIHKGRVRSARAQTVEGREILPVIYGRVQEDAFGPVMPIVTFNDLDESSRTRTTRFTASHRRSTPKTST